MGGVSARIQGSGWLGGVLRTKGREQHSSQVSPGRMEVPVAEMEKGESRMGEQRLWVKVQDQRTRLIFLLGLGWAQQKRGVTGVRGWLRGAAGGQNVIGRTHTCPSLLSSCGVMLTQTLEIEGPGPKAPALPPSPTDFLLLPSPFYSCPSYLLSSGCDLCPRTRPEYSRTSFHPPVYSALSRETEVQNPD